MDWQPATDWGATFELAPDLGKSWSTEEYIATRDPSIRDYEGTYSVTPSAERQTLPSANCLLLEDVIVEPIPSNYGLITWDGSHLTVS